MEFRTKREAEEALKRTEATAMAHRRDAARLGRIKDRSEALQHARRLDAQAARIRALLPTLEE